MDFRYFRTFGERFWKFLIFDLIFEIFLCKRIFYKGKFMNVCFWGCSPWKSRRFYCGIWKISASSSRCRNKIDHFITMNSFKITFRNLKFCQKSIKSPFLETRALSELLSTFFGFLIFSNFWGTFLKIFDFRPHFRNFPL